MTDLIKLVAGTREEIDAYLSNVSPLDFKFDVTSLVRNLSDKTVIQQAIDMLQEFVKK